MPKKLCSLLLFIASCSVLANGQIEARPKEPSSLTQLCTIGGERWIEDKLRQYPELLWLLETQTAPTHQESPENSSLMKRPSWVLFQKESPEFDIAIRNLVQLHLLLKGSRLAYSSFLQWHPNSNHAITFKQFQMAHKQLSLFLMSPKPFDDALKLLETAIVLQNVGASAKGQALFANYFQETQPNTFYTKALQVLRTFPDICPSFARLSETQKQTFTSLRQLGQYDPILTLAAAPNKNMMRCATTQKSLLTLDLIVFCLDHCGVYGYSQEFYHNFSTFVSTIQKYATMEEAFSRYLHYRAARLGLGVSPHDVILARLCNLMQLSATQDVETLCLEFNKLSSSQIQTLNYYFFSPQGEFLTCHVKGLPILMQKLYQAHPDVNATQEQRNRIAIERTLSLFVRTLEQKRAMCQKSLIAENIVLNFADTAIHSIDFDNLSDNISVRIHLNGAVSLSS